MIYLDKRIQFPDLNNADEEGLLCIGGDLSIPRLLCAYQSGIFPWYSDDYQPILWWSPQERSVIYPPQAHLSKSLIKFLRKKTMHVRVDTCFSQVIQGCAKVERAHESGTWITKDMQHAYIALHQAGFAHSFETFVGDRLVGGLYGVSIGGCFFGESMFSLEDNASKVAFAYLNATLGAWQFDILDCQLQNANVARYGAQLIPRALYLQQIQLFCKKPTRSGLWCIDNLSFDF